MAGPVELEKSLRPENDLAEREHAPSPAATAAPTIDRATSLRQAALWAQIGAGPPESPEDAAALAIDNKGAGDAVDQNLAAQVGSHTGADVSGARVHKDALSRRATRAMNARAFAHGQDIFLGPGESEVDPELMGHELAHVAQQEAAAQQKPQRKVAIGAASSPAEQHADQVGAKVAAGAAPSNLLVDAGLLAPGQMYKHEFVLGLRAIVVRVVEQELGKLGATAGCPYIDKYFSKYAHEPAHVGESLLRHWLPNARFAHSAQDLVPLVSVRVREAVRAWNTTGRLPPDLSAVDPNIAADIAAAGARTPQAHMKSLDSMEAELGAGQPLDGATAARMSRVVGADVSAARIHTGPTAQAMAAEHGAAAFAVGQNVVMGSRAPTSGIAAEALLAHELAHTAQQAQAATDPVARKKPIGEEDAAAERDAGSERLANFAGAIGDVMRTGLQLQRCQVGDVDPPGLETKDYYKKYYNEIVRDASEQLKGLPFATYDETVAWTANGMTTFANTVATESVTGWGGDDLESMVRPELMGKLISDSRVITSVRPVQDAGTVSKGPEAYFPSVGTEVGNALARRTADSLRRQIPRYAQHRIAAGGKEPKVDDIPISHPIDRSVLFGLTKGDVVTIDTKKFQAQHPTLAGAPKLRNQSRQVTLQKVDGVDGWYRLTDPMDATPEEISEALFNSPLEAFRIEVAHPLYGIAADTRGTWAEQSNATDPIVAMATAKTMVAEEAILSQAGTVDTKGARSRGQIIDQMQTNANVLRTSVKEIVDSFDLGLSGKIDTAVGWIDGRVGTLSTADDATVAKWDKQVAKQASIITRASNGLVTDQARKQAYDAKKDKDDPEQQALPHDHPLNTDIAMWVDVLLCCDLVQSAEKQLLAASNHSLTLEVEILERGMATPQLASYDAKDTTQTKADFDTDAMGKREIAQRKKLGQLRAQMLADPTKIDAAESKKTTEDAQNLIFESNVAVQASQVEHAWSALDAAVQALPVVTGGDRDDVADLKKEGKDYYQQWKAIYALIKKGEAGDPQAMADARLAFDKLAKNEKVHSYLRRVRDEIQDMKIHAMAIMLIAMIAITIVSIGAGTALTGFLGGTAIVTAEGAEVIVGGIGVGRTTAQVAGFLAEVATFTYLSNRMFSKDHSAGALLSEFGKNLIMFGAMRAVGAAFKASGLSAVAKLPATATKEEIMGAKAADLVGETLLNGGVGAMTVWIEQKVKEAFGAKPMTEEEATQAYIMAIAQAVIFTWGARLLASPMKRIEAKFAFAGRRWTAALEGWKVQRTANLAMADKVAKGGKIDPNEVTEAVRQDREQIQKEIDALEELKQEIEQDPKRAKELRKQGIDSKMLTEQIGKLGDHGQAALGVELSLSMKEIGPNHFQCDRADIGDILAAQVRSGGEFIEDPAAVHPDSGARTWIIRPTKGSTKGEFRITEKMPEWALTFQGKRAIDAARRAHMEDSAIFRMPEADRIKVIEADQALQNAGLDHAKLAKIEELLVLSGRKPAVVAAVGKATPDQLLHIAKMADVSPQAAGKLIEAVGVAEAIKINLEPAPDGQVRINGELEIHPGRLEEIDVADVKTIVEATATKPVDTARLAPFVASGSYRLRFKHNLAQNEEFLMKCLDLVGRRGDAQATRITSSLDTVGRIRLQEARNTTRDLPTGVGEELQKNATNYALDKDPGNARGFVDHYEMYISEYMRVRADAKLKIQRETARLEATGMNSQAANKQAAKNIIGKEIAGYKEPFNKEVLATFTPAQVTAREGVLRTELAGRVGGRDLGKPPDSTTIIADVRALPELQFGTESSAIYHPNKHRALPAAHRDPSYAANEVSRFLKSANETIQTGTANSERSQDGGFSISFTKAYPGKTMKAIVRVNPQGTAVIATYGDG